FKYVSEIIDLLDDPKVSGDKVKKFFEDKGFKDLLINVEKIRGEKGSTDFISIKIPGSRGKSVGGSSPTLSVIGRLGGKGARPDLVGLVSDADEAIVALAVVYKITEMRSREDILPADVIINTSDTNIICDLRIRRDLDQKDLLLFQCL
ncbi:MAG: DUF1177 family protein, partial [Sulfolobales archaeon]